MTAFEVPDTIHSAPIIDYSHTFLPTPWQYTTSIYQPTNAHIISHKTLLKHFKTLRHVSILSDHHQGALFLAKFILRYSQFNSYLQTRCCGSISCCVGLCCGTVARCASYDAPNECYYLNNGAKWVSTGAEDTTLDNPEAREKKLKPYTDKIKRVQKNKKLEYMSCR